VTLELVADNYLLVFERCSCRGNPECECACEYPLGARMIDSIDLGVLLANIAIASALEQSWRLGNSVGYSDHAAVCRLLHR
jgi:hypothetical protein